MVCREDRFSGVQFATYVDGHDVRIVTAEILARIGVGGMGDGYRARDKRLDRTVQDRMKTSVTSDVTTKARCFMFSPDSGRSTLSLGRIFLHCSAATLVAILTS